MNASFLEETDLRIIPYILKQQIKESKRYKRTKPFHGRKSCEDRNQCLVHGGR